MDVLGKTMIFKGDYGYYTTVSNKNQDGTYDNMRVSVQLPKGIEMENKTKLNILKGFLSFYKSKDGLPKIKIVIQDYSFEEQNDDDLPF